MDVIGGGILNGIDEDTGEKFSSLSFEVEEEVPEDWKKFRKDVQERVKEVRKLPREELIRFYGKMKKKYMELFPDAPLKFPSSHPIWLTATKMEVATKMGKSIDEIRGLDFSDFPEDSFVTVYDKETGREIFTRCPEKDPPKLEPLDWFGI